MPIVKIMTMLSRDLVCPWPLPSHWPPLMRANLFLSPIIEASFQLSEERRATVELPKGGDVAFPDLFLMPQRRRCLPKAKAMRTTIILQGSRSNEVTVVPRANDTVLF